MSSYKPPSVEETLLRANRFAAITKAPFPLEEVSLRWVSGAERLMRPFHYRVRFISTEPLRDFGKLPGQKMTVGLKLADRKKTRYFNGVIWDVDFMGIEDNRRLNYEIELRPWISMLELRRNSRIFQNKTSLDIIRTIFGEHSGQFQVKVRTTPPPRVMCVQYNETDLAFVSRLMEQDGLSYFFEHTESEHTLILTDDVADCPFCEPAQIHSQLNLKKYRYKDDMIWRWFEHVAVTSGKVTVRDYDFEKPKVAPEGLEPVTDVEMGEVKGTVAQRHGSGASSGKAGETATRTSPRTEDTREVFDYPGRFKESEHAAFYAKRRAEAIGCHAYRVEVEGSMRQLAVGNRFRAENPYDQPDMINIEPPETAWLAMGVKFEISGEVGDRPDDVLPHGIDGDVPFLYRAIIEAQLATTPFRPEALTPRPYIRGLQTAVVLGSGGQPDGEISTEKYGRLRVKFHWDRGPGEKTSCWLRVAQSWAGNGFGGLVTPRPGQEVVIAFEEGDPDRPIIVGTAYNADNMPPENLPDDATRSVFRTQSVPGNSQSYNQLRFEDRSGSEEILMRAEKDYNLKVGAMHCVNVDDRYVLEVGPLVGLSRAQIEIDSDRIALVVRNTRNPLTPQGIEITGDGVSILGDTVGVMARMGKIATIPFPTPVPTPELTQAELDMKIPPLDTRIND